MADAEVRIEGLEEMLRKLDAATANDTIRTAMHGAVALIHDRVKVYPEPPEPGDWPGFVSDKQRRWFFWALRSGQIQVPYRRSGLLGQSWRPYVEGAGMATKGIVDTNLRYAPYVQSRGEQARIHQGRWGTIQTVVEQNGDEAARVFADEVEQAMKGA